jgi:DNA-directed RNA polymerase subunit RPC12/RpoP
LRARAAGARLKLECVRASSMQRIEEKTAMLGEDDTDTVELECPECGARVKTTAKEAEKGKVRCPRGHEFVVMGMLGALDGSQGSGAPKRR